MSQLGFSNENHLNQYSVNGLANKKSFSSLAKDRKNTVFKEK